jgi:hypothetical protein
LSADRDGCASRRPLTGGSLVAVALSYAVGLLAFAEAGGNPDAARNLVRTIGIDAPQRRLGLS